MKMENIYGQMLKFLIAIKMVNLKLEYFVIKNKNGLEDFL